MPPGHATVQKLEKLPATPSNSQHIWTLGFLPTFAMERTPRFECLKAWQTLTKRENCAVNLGCWLVAKAFVSEFLPVDGSWSWQTYNELSAWKPLLVNCIPQTKHGTKWVIDEKDCNNMHLLRLRYPSCYKYVKCPMIWDCSSPIKALPKLKSPPWPSAVQKGRKFGGPWFLLLCLIPWVLAHKAGHYSCEVGVSIPQRSLLGSGKLMKTNFQTDQNVRAGRASWSVDFFTLHRPRLQGDHSPRNPPNETRPHRVHRKHQRSGEHLAFQRLQVATSTLLGARTSADVANNPGRSHPYKGLQGIKSRDHNPKNLCVWTIWIDVKLLSFIRF